MFVTTINLSHGTLAIHDRGKVATWVRASASPPALWPPVADTEGSLHVDGAVLDNLPVETMRHGGADRVIAVDVSTAGPFRVGPGSPEVASALTPFRGTDKTTRYPNLVKVLNRSAVVTSLRARELARESADLLIVPELAGIGLTEYGSAARIIELGYTATCEALDRAQDDLAAWT